MRLRVAPFRTPHLQHRVVNSSVLPTRCVLKGSTASSGTALTMLDNQGSTQQELLRPEHQGHYPIRLVICIEPSV